MECTLPNMVYGFDCYLSTLLQPKEITMKVLGTVDINLVYN